MLFAASLDALIAAIFASDAVQWARAVFDSRAFNLNLRGNVELVLAPVSDMINHSSRWSDILVRRADDRRKGGNINNNSNTDEPPALVPAADDDANAFDEEAEEGDGDMVMQLGAGITRGQLRAASAAYPHRELYMSYGPLQNWELLLSYGFALGDVSEVPATLAKTLSSTVSSSTIPAETNNRQTSLALVGGNPYDRLPLPIELGGVDEGATAVDAAYSQRRSAAIARHFLSVGNGVWVGMREEERVSEDTLASVADSSSLSSSSSPAVIFPAVVALMRLYCATIDEFGAVEADPFAPCPTLETEAKVWASLRATLAAVVAVVGAGGVIEEEEEEEEETEVAEEAEGDSSSSSSSSSDDDAVEEEQDVVEEDPAVSLAALKASIARQLRRIVNLKATVAAHKQRTMMSNGADAKGGDAAATEEEDDEEEQAAAAAASAINEHLALLVSVPLRQIAAACLERCDVVTAALLVE